MKLIYSQIRNIACMVLVMGAMTAMYGQCPPGESQACVTYTSGSFNGENSWLLYDATAGVELLCDETAAAAGTTSVCVVEGNNIQLYAYETFGDSWNGATISVAYCDDGSANNCPQNEVLYGPNDDPGLVSGNGSVTCGSGIGTGVLAWNGGFINCIDCDPVCAADLTVNNDPGVCGAQLTIANPPALDPVCGQGGVAIGESTVDGTVQNFIPQGGVTHNQDYVYTIPGVVLNTAPCVTEVCVDYYTDTDNGAGFETIQLEGEDGTNLGSTATGGGDCNPNPGQFCMPVALYNTYAADGNLSITMLANTGVNFCALNDVQMSVTTFTGCDLYVNDYNGTADASDFYPVGTTLVTFTTTINGVIVTCTTSVTVVDNEAPTFNCPADQTISLDAGECSDIFHFDLSVMDNCPSIPFSVDGPFCNPCDDPTGGSALACAPFAQNSIIQPIATGGVAGAITQVCYNQETFGNAPLATFNIYSNDGSATIPWDDGAGTFAGILLGTQEYQTVPGNSGTCVCVDFDIPVMVDATITSVWLEVFTPGTTLNSRIVNTPGTCNGNTATGMDTYIAAPACGLTPPQTFASVGFILDAGYSLTVQPGELEAIPYPTNQWVSGDNLPIGEHCFGYNATDAAGNVATCEFCITVDEFPEELQTTSLACNDLVNISVDQDCQVVLTADDILEGGPYGCYDTYMVNAEIVPANAVSGNNTSAVTINANSIPAFAANGMAGTYKVSVIDPGNANNSCWGYIMLEDKLAPTVTCEDVTISCISSSEPAFPITGSTSVSNFDTGIQWGDGTTGDVGSVTSTLSAPAGAKITDLSVTIQLDHSWLADLDIVLTTPDGTDIALVAANQCGNVDNINATFSASATTPASCGGCAVAGAHEDCNVPALYETCASITMEVQAIGDLSTLLGGNVNGDWTVSFADGVGGDGGCLHSLSMSADYVIGAATPAVAMDNCTPVVPTYNDVVTDLDCQTGFDRIITRRWIASDTKGNTSNVCVQTITVESITIGDVPLPFEIVDLPCGTGDVTPWDIASYYDNPLTKDVNGTVIIENNEGIPYAFPHYFAGVHPQPIPESGLCGIYADYKDHVIDACGAHCHGNKKILRTWKLLDWCTQTFDEYIQIIRAKDLTPPTFIVKDTTVSTRPWDCTGEFMVPEPWELHDNCDIAPTYTVVGPPGVIITPKAGGGYIASGAKKGVHQFIYTASDCCNNSTTQTANIAVLDYVAPNLTTKGDIIVSLSPGGLVDTAALAKLFCRHIDNGSYDVCTPTHCEIRRPMGSPDCSNLGINDHNNNMTFNNTDIRFQSGAHPDDNRNDTDGGEFVKFCCEDITRIEGDANDDGLVDSLDAGYVKVIIRVWDDANMSGVYGDEVPPFAGLAPQKDNYNEGWAWVKVECKSIPVITCPPPVTVKCYWDVNFDPSAGWRSLNDVDLSKSGVASAYGCCGQVDVEFSDAGNLTECEEGTFVRTFRAGYTNIDGKQSYVQCQQQITVLRDEYPVTITPKNRLFNNPSCAFDPALINQMRPTVVGGPCDVIGENISVDTFLFENGVCKKWRVTFEYWNWCLNENLGTYVEYAIYEDTDDPVIMNCQDTCIGVDVNCQAVLVLTNAAFDTSACTDMEWIKWICEVDLWGDGTIDYVAATHFTQTNWTFDLDPWYGPITKIHIDATASKDSEDQPMDMLSADQIVTVTIPEAIVGKMSNHKVTWKAIDGCHNESGCSMNVMVADKKAPTPYCVNISSAVMADGSVELWARDFDKNSFDNCTDQVDLYFTFNEMRGPLKDTIIRVSNRDYTVNADIPYFFDANGFVGFDGDGVVTDVNGNIIPAASQGNINKYNQGDIQKWVPSFHSSSKIFDCDEYNAQGPNGALVKMSVWDKKCNTDFCVVYLSLVDNQGGCGSPTPRVAGTILTEAGDDLANVTVTIEGDVNDLTKVQTVNGAYSFNVPRNVNYEVTAVKDVDYMNGISTLDLVLIQRHILGLTELDSGLKFISADVNGDMEIRVNDLVDLRKLILGVTNDFPATSWKAVDASEAIAMTTPLQYSEVVYVDNFQTDVLDADFIATKVGDVSGDALSNARSIATENRSARVVSLVAADQKVEAGQTVEVAITGSDFNDVYGYQFTSNLNGLTLSGVRSGAIAMTDANLGLPSTNVMTASFAADKMVSVSAGEVLFTLEFVATTSGNLSEMMNINSSVTKAESYTGVGMEVSGIELTFRTEEPTATAAYALNQNEPNPFKDVTSVTYEMAEAGQATFTLYDVTGKVLVVQTEQADKGLNTVEFKASNIRASGIVYYQIESGNFTATKKMIIIE